MNQTRQLAIIFILIYALIQAVQGLMLMIKDLAVYFVRRRFK